MDDAKLLVGVYEHGLGNWESIRDDPNLGLSSKILRAESSLKPQASHLQTRVEYLLKLILAEAAEKMRKKVSGGVRSQFSFLLSVAKVVTWTNQIWNDIIIFKSD